MEYSDTVKLLRECDAGTKMAVISIDEVLDEVRDQGMKALLEESKRHHTALGNEIHAKLLEHGSGEKDPNPIAKGMSWLKTNWKMSLEQSDSTAAELMTDGCNMGIKSLSQYLNEYKAAAPEAKILCQRLIKIEEELEVGLRAYLH